MEESENISENFEKELEKIQSQSMLGPEFRKRKRNLWLIRTFIALILYVFLWEYEWIKWTLWLYIPLSLFSLFSIYGWNFILKRKIKRARKKISEAEQLVEELPID